MLVNQRFLPLIKQKIHIRFGLCIQSYCNRTHHKDKTKQLQNNPKHTGHKIGMPKLNNNHPNTTFAEQNKLKQIANPAGHAKQNKYYQQNQ